MARALAEYKVVGVRTTIPLLEHSVGDPDFAAGRLSTAFLDRLLDRARPEAQGRRRSIALIAAALAAYNRAGVQAPPPASSAIGAWRQAVRPGWRSR